MDLQVLVPTVLLLIGALIGAMPLGYALYMTRASAERDAERIKELLQLIEITRAPDQFLAIRSDSEQYEPEGGWIADETGMCTYWRTPDGQLYHSPGDVPR